MWDTAVGEMGGRCGRKSWDGGLGGIRGFGKGRWGGTRDSVMVEYMDTRDDFRPGRVADSPRGSTQS